MVFISQSEITKLHKVTDFPCITIFLPLEIGRLRQNALELKNILKQVEIGLIKSGVKKADCRQLLEKAHKLVHDSLFWENQKGGLALFISRRFLFKFSLPIKFNKQIIIGQRFETSTLIKVIEQNFEFYILALSKRYVQLFKADMYDIKPVNLKILPKNLQEALNLDEIQLHLKTHSVGRGYGSGFHGHGSAKDIIKTDLRHYFKRVDQALHSFLLRERLPLVLAMVDYFVPIYQEVNTYSRLVNGAVIGNPENVQPKELQQKAARLVKKYLKRT